MEPNLDAADKYLDQIDEIGNYINLFYIFHVYKQASIF